MVTGYRCSGTEETTPRLFAQAHTLPITYAAASISSGANSTFAKYRGSYLTQQEVLV